MKRTNVPKAKKHFPFDEMRRLMEVYGSTKCLRNKRTENMKISSVRRKFYRWFPDLEERFVQNDAGFYMPKLGHEFEMRYREEMRKKDMKILGKKRQLSRFDASESKSVKKVALDLWLEESKQAVTSSILSETAASARRSSTLESTPDTSSSSTTSSLGTSESATAVAVAEFESFGKVTEMCDYSQGLSGGIGSTECNHVATSSSLSETATDIFTPTRTAPVARDHLSSTPSSLDQEPKEVIEETVHVHLEPVHDLMASSASIVEDCETMDSCFIPELGIFDDIESCLLEKSIE